MSSKALAHPLGNVPILQSKKTGAAADPADTGVVAVPVVLATPIDLMDAASGKELIAHTPDGQLVLVRIPTVDEFYDQFDRDIEGAPDPSRVPARPSLEMVGSLVAPFTMPEGDPWNVPED
jgi:hypothetical protein